MGRLHQRGRGSALGVGVMSQGLAMGATLVMVMVATTGWRAVLYYPSCSYAGFKYLWGNLSPGWGVW